MCETSTLEGAALPRKLLRSDAIELVFIDLSVVAKAPRHEDARRFTKGCTAEAPTAEDAQLAGPDDTCSRRYIFGLVNIHFKALKQAVKPHPPR